MAMGLSCSPMSMKSSSSVSPTGIWPAIGIPAIAGGVTGIRPVVFMGYGAFRPLSQVSGGGGNICCTCGVPVTGVPLGLCNIQATFGSAISKGCA
eukprot:2574661-Amphidinium_carterae.1